MDNDTQQIYLQFFEKYSRLENIWKDDIRFYNWEEQRIKLVPIAQALSNLTISSLENDSALIKYQNENPPKSQVGPKNWIEYSPPKFIQSLPKTTPGLEMAILIDKMRNVRNNLFHGGKWSDLCIDKERSKKLVMGSIALMNAILANTQVDWGQKYRE